MMINKKLLKSQTLIFVILGSMLPGNKDLTTITLTYLPRNASGDIK